MDDFNFYLEKTKEIGYIVSLSSSIAYVSGLPNLKLEEMIITSSGQKGIVHGLKEKQAEILMIDAKKLRIGEKVTRTNKLFEIPISQGLLGRIVNPLCLATDGLGPIKQEKQFQPVIKPAPSFIERSRVKEPLETGVMMVDFLVPIGYGQRELIIGDAKTGKTTFVLQTMASQARKDIVCVYVAIGKKDTAVKWVEEYLKKQKAIDQTVIVHTAPDDSPSLIYLAPYSGMTIAEYFRNKGKNVLIVLDDLTVHAKTYREISLLLKRMPGRDSYPGEIFHIHAALLERAGNIKNNNHENSITALPMAETLENDLSGYIQTNLMAMTDGHIFFDSNEFKKGKRPAINAFLSVSRVGNQTKHSLEKQISSWIRKKLAEYERLLEFVQFGAELPPEIQKNIEFGERLNSIFNQESETKFPGKVQIILIGLLLSDFWRNKSLREMKNDVNKIIEQNEKNNLPELKETLDEIKDFDHLLFLIKEIIPQIEKIIS
jgi:F-type H+/Na+-transporting ATPase subunit alpha